MKNKIRKKFFLDIPWQEALKLINRYKNKHRIKVDVNDPDSPYMESLFFDRKVFDFFCDSNNSIDEVYVAWAYHPGSNLPNIRPGYSIVLFGMRNNQILTGANDVIWDAVVGGAFNSNNPQNIGLSEAKSIISNYQQNQQYHLETTYVKSGIPPWKSDLLKGCVINQSDLNKIKNLHEVGIFLEFILGFNDDFSFESYRVQRGHTWIILGNYDSNKTHLGRMTNEGNPIIDYCDPCPQKCPNNEHLLR